MRTLTEEEAGGLYCPIRSKTEEDDPLQCDGSVCMAWQESLTEDGKGFCALIYKPGINQPSILLSAKTD